jgi:hypothetical protein
MLLVLLLLCWGSPSTRNDLLLPSYGLALQTWMIGGKKFTNHD